MSFPLQGWDWLRPELLSKQNPSVVMVGFQLSLIPTEVFFCIKGTMVRYSGLMIICWSGGKACLLHWFQGNICLSEPFQLLAHCTSFMSSHKSRYPKEIGLTPWFEVSQSFIQVELCKKYFFQRPCTSHRPSCICSKNLRIWFEEIAPEIHQTFLSK